MKRFKGAIPVMLALAATSQLYAQPARPTVTMNAADMQQSVVQLEAQIRADSQHVLNLQARARKEKDVIKLSCINDKMIKLKAEANLFDQVKIQLIGVLDRDERFTVFDSVTQAADRVHKERQQADECAGQPELGESGNDFTAPEIPDDPTAGLPFDDVVVGGSVEPPGYASPYN